MIIEAADLEAEQALKDEISSTGKGGGAAAARRIMGRRRSDPPVRLARDVDELAPFTQKPTAEILEDAFRAGKKVLLEGEVQTWVAQLKLSASSVAHAHTALAGILDDAVADRRLATNPARGVKLPRKTMTKPRNYLTAAQVSALADESKHPDIVLLLATTGLRWGEMAALRVRDINLGRGRIRVERSASKVNSKTVIGTTKTHAARSVAVSASVLKHLGPAMVGKAPDELLWYRADGQPLRPPTTTHWFGAAVKRCQAVDAKFPRVTVHELRHTAASLMIASGANVKTVQSQLGHKTATMTLDQYGHLFPDDLDDVADKMDDLVSECAQNVPTRRESGDENAP